MVSCHLLFYRRMGPEPPIKSATITRITEGHNGHLTIADTIATMKAPINKSKKTDMPL